MIQYYRKKEHRYEMSAKQMKQYIHNGDRFWKISFVAAQAISILLIIASFCIPPHGVIDSSVFAAVGELFAFPALLSFYNIVMSGRQATLKKGELEVTVNESNEEINKQV